ncbi:P-loop NTPase fold protein [Corallococcus aberystwythensis]|uniref:P-loop NTPase fold protein n=1 Tax=Corallococcus aberystwythensis TaxID=2316722 RepID=UPI0013152430|nr:P-loop NTPase fold protein [Corallococcus aberystwythensis]
MRRAVLNPWSKLLLEYLVAALVAESSGPLPNQMRRKGITSDELMGRIQEWSQTAIALNGSYDVTPLETVPELSSYVREALELAAKAADAQRSAHIESTHLLYGVLSVTDSPLVQAMAAMGLSRELIVAEPVDTPILAGFRPDDLQGEDRLGIDPEVQALVSVLAARDVAPPLSLGLFGDWGSGKSFFMRRLEKSIDAVAATAAPGYCEKIVQIRFNAWSYIDTQNLWASLTSEIFEQLAQKLSSGDTVTAATKRAQLLAATDSSRNVLAEAQKQKESVALSLRQSEERLQKLESAEEELRSDLRDVKLNRNTLQRILETTGLQKQADELSAKLQLPLKQALTTEGIEQLLELRSLSGRLRAFWQSLSVKPSGERRNFLLLLLVCLGLPLLALFVAPHFIDAWKELCGFLGVAGIAGLVLKLRPFLAAAKAAAKELETAWNAATAQIEERKQARRTELETERKALTLQVDQAQKSVDEATQALHDVEAQLDALRADRQVSDFIRKRHQSTDYTQHLGVIARAQQDFERLTELLKAAREEHSSMPSDLPRIDRIILYIDDLDRCPEDKVVDVLQAVHLLLAFELFVVVVGVDSRWLLHSLQQSSNVFQSSLRKDSGMSTEEQHHWQSTPLNYLEKIFQIPYALRGMEPEGFGSLIDDLTQASAEPPAAIQAPPREPTSQPVLPAPTASTPEPKPLPALEAGPALRGEPPPPPPAPLLLRITDEERRYMKALHGFIPSPRAAKRFVNTYRLLHASLPPNERATFVGNQERLGECLFAQFLLALLIGHPAEAARVLETLVELEPTGSWWDFIFGFFANETARDGSLEHREKLLARIADIRAQRIFPEDLTCGTFVKWAPRVARYSFQARSVLMARKKPAPFVLHKESKAS